MTAVRKYQETHVATASPMELVIMLYDEAIRSLDKAVAGFSVEDPSRFEVIGNSILHAQDVITELTISLDMEKGGEVAHHLQRLYDFMVQHLSTADVEKNIKGVLDVRRMLADLKESWVQVAKHEVVSEESQWQARGANTIHVTG
jgi:flagellar protein FliS